MTSTLRLSALALCIGSALVGCGSAATLVVRPTTPSAPELVPTPQLQDYAYKHVLLLPPEGGVGGVDAMDIQTVREHGVPYYMNKLEKLLLSQGFEVISQEIVARVGQKAAQNAGSAAQRALIMGKETHADAVLMVQSIAVVRDEKFYDSKDFSEVEPGLRVEDDGEWSHKETGDCLFTLPYYELRFEAKMVDVQSGNVLWVGSARETTLDALAESWTAKLDDDCGIEEQQPFIYKDALASEATLDRTVASLYDRLFTPLKKTALAGRPLVKEEPKVEPPKNEPPPPPVVEAPKAPEPPKPKMAVVSSAQGIMREGPGKKEARVRSIPRKAKVEVIETMGEWIKVKAQDGTTGWMHETMLIIPD